MSTRNSIVLGVLLLLGLACVKQAEERAEAQERGAAMLQVGQTYNLYQFLELNQATHTIAVEEIGVGGWVKGALVGIIPVSTLRSSPPRSRPQEYGRGWVNLNQFIFVQPRQAP